MDLQRSRYILPNLFTLTNAGLGLIALWWALKGDEWHLKAAAVAIVSAMLADMMDGRVARMTKTQSRFGVQLDSLADAVSFGVVPGVLSLAYGIDNLDLGWVPLGIISAMVFLFGGLLRLARFNVTAENGKSSPFFEGLPIPGAAAVVVTTIWVSLDLSIPRERIYPLLVGLLVILGFLMVSRVRYYSFKDLKAGWEIRAAMLIVGTVAVLAGVLTKASYVFLGFALFYALLGPLKEFRSLMQRALGHILSQDLPPKK